jgi:membrane associated rhomboid family serine protease
LVGSSGAVFGVIAVLFLLMPFKLTFTMVVPLPSVIVGLMLSAVELSAFWMATDIGVAHDAHLVGFITGGLCAFVIDKKRALKGLFIALVVLAAIYYLGAYFNLVQVKGLTL